MLSLASPTRGRLRALWLVATLLLGAPPQAGALQDRSATERGSSTSSLSSPPPLLERPFETPRQLLRLLDIGPSDLDSFTDSEPLGPNDEEAFMKTLFRLPQISELDIERWTHREVTPSTIAQQPSPWRGEFVAIAGHACAVTRRTVPQPWSELFELTHYWEVAVEVPSGGDVTVYARQVPAAWQQASPLRQPCRVRGMFLKLGTPDQQRPHLLFAAHRVQWYPDQLNASLGVGPGQILLAQLGMDIGLFDTVRGHNSGVISAAQRSCFYHLLRVTQQAAAADLARLAQPLDLGPLLQRPDSLQGQLLRVPGSVRRITRVPVDDRDIQQQLGITHYYQLDVLVPLGGAEIRIQSNQPGEPGPVYRTNFPVTCSTLSIPEAWQPLVGQERINATATLDGVFFKIWTYKNPYVASFDSQQGQICPLLITGSPAPEAAWSPGQDALSFALGVGFLVALAATWLAVWYLNRSDRRRAQASQRTRPEATPSFDHLDGAGPAQH